MDDGFRPAGATRVERRHLPATTRIAVLKLDHLGDFILALPAMERLRTHFPHARITLVCGSWNRAAAHGLGLFDAIIPFDAFAPDSAATTSAPDMLAARLLAALDGSFDLAIDLRVDDDTRPLLLAVSATLRAGIGTRSRFAFLDVFLPIDATRAQPPPPCVLAAHQFRHNPPCTHLGYGIAFSGAVTQPGILVYGPYLPLPHGKYRFSPYMENVSHALLIEAVIDDIVVAQETVSAGDVIRFHNRTPSGHLQIRFTRKPSDPPASFRFFGGTLERAPVTDGLHQSEYLVLLVELLAFRVKSAGLLTGDAAP